MKVPHWQVPFLQVLECSNLRHTPQTHPQSNVACVWVQAGPKSAWGPGLTRGKTCGIRAGQTPDSRNSGKPPEVGLSVSMVLGFGWFYGGPRQNLGSSGGLSDLSDFQSPSPNFEVRDPKDPWSESGAFSLYMEFWLGVV